MNSAIKDLSNIPAGFANDFHTSQMVFRTALKALSYPGKLHTLEHDAPVPNETNPVIGGLLLALLDSETSLWSSNSMTMNFALDWLKFHTDCAVFKTTEEADFLWIKNIRDLPNLKKCKLGSDQYPDKSATCLIEVPNLNKKSPWRYKLKGPGIKFEEKLEIQGWDEEDYHDFLSFWNENNRLFPCGIDVFLSDGQYILGLPRTTHLAYSEGDT
jgi:alpha-D-ribose 1-methylphosphonate 5-triphosphate synthase subunit PhnH